METTETASPLTRFADIIQKLYSNSYQNVEQIPFLNLNVRFLGGAISDALGSTPIGNQFSSEEMIFDYSRLTKIALDALQFTRLRSGPKSVETNCEIIMFAINVIFTNTYQASAQVFSDGQQYSATSMKLLIALSDNMSHFNSEKVVSGDDIAFIIESIDELIAVVRESEIDNIIKLRMIEILSVMRIQILKVNIIGAKDVVDGIDVFFGQTVRAALTATTKEETQSASNILEKAVKFANNVQGLIETGQKIYPVLEAAARMLNI